MIRAGVLTLAALALAGCSLMPKPDAATRTPALACAPGQEQLQTAQLFLGGRSGRAASVIELQSFIDQEVAPRFPDGVTVLDAGRQWQGSDNLLIRDAAKVVQIVLPPRSDPQAPMEAIRAAYRTKFQQDSVVVVTPPACVSF